MITDLDDEFKRLRRRVDELEARLPGSSKTTKAERAAMRDHIAELDAAMKKKVAAIPVPPAKINIFKIGQLVEQDLINNPLTKGKVAYIACRFALPKFRKEENACDKKTCQHKNKHYVWVMWPDRSTFAYHFGKLRLLTEEDLKPKIGKELSGRIGPWLYDAEKKIWKKDGDAKEYTGEEFADAMYDEEHPNAKEEAAYILKAILNMGRPMKRDWHHEEEISIDDSDFGK